MISASYFDGRSATVHPARVAVRNGELLISAPGIARIYPLGGGPAGTTVAEALAEAPLMLRFADGASCEVPSGPGCRALMVALGYRASRVERWQARWPAVLVALVLLLGLIGGAWFWGIPTAAEHIAARLPDSVDITLGRTALAGLEARKLIRPSELPIERIEAVEALLPRALPARPRLPVRLIVRAAPQLGANALALPDGTIIVTDDMVKLVESDGAFDAAAQARLLAVLGHEVGHLERRHAARVMAGSSLAAAISATLFGDFSAVAAGLPTVLAQMQYSRAMELEADDYALPILRRNGIPPGTFAEVLGRLARANPVDANLPRWMKNTLGYVSTHPDTAARIDRVRAADRSVR